MPLKLVHPDPRPNRLPQVLLDIAAEVTSIAVCTARDQIVADHAARAARPVRTQSNRGDDPWRD